MAVCYIIKVSLLEGSDCLYSMENLIPYKPIYFYNNSVQKESRKGLKNKHIIPADIFYKEILLSKYKKTHFRKMDEDCLVDASLLGLLLYIKENIAMQNNRKRDYYEEKNSSTVSRDWLYL